MVKLADGSELGCKVLLLAMGVSYRKLDVPGAEHLLGPLDRDPYLPETSVPGIFAAGDVRTAR